MSQGLADKTARKSVSGSQHLLGSNHRSIKVPVTRKI